MPLPRRKKVKSSDPKPCKSAAWTRIEQRADALEGDWCIGEVLNLPGWKTSKYKETEHDVIVFAEAFEEGNSSCPCGATGETIRPSGSAEPRYLWDRPIRGKRTRIYFPPRRRRCKACDKETSRSLPSIHEKHGATSRLVSYVERESLNMFSTFVRIADEIGCSEATVRNIYAAHVTRLNNAHVIETPRWLAIDEVHPRNKRGACCVISDPESRRVLDLLPKNNPGVLANWLLRLPDRDGVEVVTTDMWHEYRNAVKKMLPDARLVVDRYHIHNLLSTAFKEVLDVVRACMSDSERREHMRHEGLLLKNHRRLSDKPRKDERGRDVPSVRDVVAMWLEGVPVLKEPYKLNADLSDILQSTDRGAAETLLDGWLTRVVEFVKYFRGKYEKRVGAKWTDPYGTVPWTIGEWRANILNYVELKHSYDFKPTNAFAEFANKQIKRAYRMGYYTHEVLRSKVVHGGILVDRRPDHPLDGGWSRNAYDRGTRRVNRTSRSTNPESNIERIKNARERNGGIDLSVVHPQDVPVRNPRIEAAADYKRRVVFGAASLAPKEVELPGIDDLRPQIKEPERIVAESAVRLSRSTRYNPDQTSMF